MNRGRDLLGVAYLAAKGVDVDPCRGLAEKFATLIDIIENEVDDAMMKIPRDEKAARAEAQSIGPRPGLIGEPADFEQMVAEFDLMSVCWLVLLKIEPIYDSGVQHTPIKYR